MNRFFSLFRNFTHYMTPINSYFVVDNAGDLTVDNAGNYWII